jgi:bifunctional enzyme CysN/CysC
MGRDSLKKKKKYKMRLSTQEVECEITKIYRIIDAANLDTNISQEVVNVNQVAEISIHTKRPIAFDFYRDFEDTGRFVLVDKYDVSGGGIITQAIHEDNELMLEVARRRDFSWIKGDVSMADRTLRNGHREGLILISGSDDNKKAALSKKLEYSLFQSGKNAYLLDGSNLRFGLDADITEDYKKETVRRFGETAHILMTAGLIVIAPIKAFSSSDVEDIINLVHPSKAITIHLLEDKESKAEEIDLNISFDTNLDDQVKEIIRKSEEKGILL